MDLPQNENNLPVVNDFEKEIFQSIKNLVDSFLSKLSDRGIKVSVLPLKRSMYEFGLESEVEIQFYRNQNLVDVLEFFVYYAGTPNIDADELIKWLKDQLQDIVDKN